MEVVSQHAQREVEAEGAGRLGPEYQKGLDLGKRLLPSGGPEKLKKMISSMPRVDPGLYSQKRKRHRLSPTHRPDVTASKAVAVFHCGCSQSAESPD